MSEVKKLGDLVQKVARIVKTKSKTNRSLSVKWAEIADQDVLEHTDVKGLKTGVLYVRVASAPWLPSIQAFQKEELLMSIQIEYKQQFISDIRFYIGSLAGGW